MPGRTWNAAATPAAAPAVMKSRLHATPASEQIAACTSGAYLSPVLRCSLNALHWKPSVFERPWLTPCPTCQQQTRAGATVPPLKQKPATLHSPWHLQIMVNDTVSAARLGPSKRRFHNSYAPRWMEGASRPTGSPDETANTQEQNFATIV